MTADEQAAALQALMLSDPWRLRLLRAVHGLGLPDCWIAAGFVRNAVWDSLCGRPAAPADGDVDVIWHDPARAGREADMAVEANLRRVEATVDWSVKNQARMHLRNGDRPYRCSADAMRRWPETATAIGVRLRADGGLDIAAPHGLDDLYLGILRPTPAFRLGKRAIFDARVRDKQWLRLWPVLRLEPESGSASSTDGTPCRQ